MSMNALNHAAGFAGVATAALGLIWAAVSDVTRYEIPHRACGLVVTGFAVAALGAPLGDWGPGLATGLAVLGFGALLFSRGLMGGGDVKLAAAAALWAGPTHLSDFAVVTSLSGLALAALLMTPLRRRLPSPPGAVTADFRQPMPFGAPLALGGAWVAFSHLALVQGA